jgi:hypothetical protein
MSWVDATNANHDAKHAVAMSAHAVPPVAARRTNVATMATVRAEKINRAVSGFIA